MPSTIHTPKLAYSIREACEASSLGRTTIYALIGAGKLQAVRVGGRTVIPATSLSALVGMACERDTTLGNTAAS
ncbi:helix-turn-helix domain-containing protein [Seohaeicola saemankumensis]|uniref:Helix-turn-helix domain-containing protein n=1 Tax=Seohaeicola saemankumensis TaxID=481181 RepID=A0ABW3TIV9_9RHOB